MKTLLSVATGYGFRLVARFVVLLLALSVLFDLMGQISVDYLELEGPFEPDKQALFSALYLGILNEDWGKGSLTGLLWHYIPAIVLSFLFDLVGRTCFDSLELEGPFLVQRMTVCSALTFGMLTDALAKASLAGRLWHYLPAIVVSLSVAIAWILVDRHRLASEIFSTKARMNKAPLPLLRRLALRFAVLLFVLVALYDFSRPMSFCFDPSSPMTLPTCFRTFSENWLLMARKGGLPGLAWHYLPVAVVATVIMIDWAWTYCRGRRE